MTLDRTALSSLLDALGGDQGDLAELVRSFLDEAPSLAADASRGYADGDLEMLKRAVHCLRSGAMNFGALKLASLCERIELQCRRGDVRGLDLELAQVDATLRLAMIELEQLEASPYLALSV